MENKKHSDVLAISIPRKTLDDASLDNLKALIKSKESLLRKALGIENVELLIDDERIGFYWFIFTGDPIESKAYSHLVTALCELAKKLKRVNLKEEKEVENEKYAFRCFLLRLGFVGPQFKEERKLLLKNFSGSSAFKNPIAEEARA